MKFKRVIALCMGMLLLLTAACASSSTSETTDADSTEASETEELSESEEAEEVTLTLSSRTLFMDSGDKETLTAEGADDVTFTSSRPGVAEVDADGNVTAVAKGNAIITAQSGDAVAYCGVIVDLTEEYIDLNEQEMKAYGTDLTLERYTIARDFDVDFSSDTLYFVQTYTYMPSDLIFTKMELVKNSWVETEYMHLYESGYGTMYVETQSDGVYMWTNSNGDLRDVGMTISYVEWEDKALYQQEYGITMDFGGSIEEIAVDLTNDLVVTRTAGETYKVYTYYDRTALLSGEEPIALYSVSYSTSLSPTTGVDESSGQYASLTNQDFTVSGGYIYQLNGKAENDVYVSCFDIYGNLVYVRYVDEYSDLEYREPTSITCNDGTIAICFASGTSGNRWSNVFYFE